MGFWLLGRKELEELKTSFLSKVGNLLYQNHDSVDYILKNQKPKTSFKNPKNQPLFL